MKFLKLIPAVLLLAFVSSCDKDEPYKLYSDNVQTDSKVVAIAQKAAEDLYPTVGSRSESRSVSSIYTIPSVSSRALDADTLMYVVNFSGDKGFVLISSDASDNEVLAVIDHGNYNPAEPCDNPGFNMFMDAATEYIKQRESTESELNIDAASRAAGKIDTIAYYHCPPKLGLSWGQKGIYGKFCPNKVSGCVPLASASIIVALGYEFNLETTVNYTFPGTDITSQKMPWFYMYCHKYGENPPNESCNAVGNTEAHDAIGRFIRQIGYEEQADYSRPNATGCSSDRMDLVYNAFKKYLPGFDVSGILKFHCYYVTQKIDRGFLFLFAQDRFGNGGHAWVADGYHFVKTRNSNNQESIESLTHFCWGWNGAQDGYFADNAFYVGSYLFKDPGYIAVTQS